MGKHLRLTELVPSRLQRTLNRSAAVSESDTVSEVQLLSVTSWFADTLPASCFSRNSMLLTVTSRSSLSAPFKCILVAPPVVSREPEGRREGSLRMFGPTWHFSSHEARPPLQIIPAPWPVGWSVVQDIHRQLVSFPVWAHTRFWVWLFLRTNLGCEKFDLLKYKSD